MNFTDTGGRSNMMRKLGAYWLAHGYISLLAEITEEFLLYLIASMYLIGRTDFVPGFFEAAKVRFDEEELRALGFSHNF